jgi:hypothetical protein
VTKVGADFHFKSELLEKPALPAAKQKMADFFHSGIWFDTSPRSARVCRSTNNASHIKFGCARRTLLISASLSGPNLAP